MNWYKKAQQDNIWDEIYKYWALGKNNDLAIEHIMKRMNMSKEEAEDFFYKNDALSEMYRRDAFVKRYSWASPTKEAIERIKQFTGNDTILEIGSGYGLWARLLKDEGVNIVATNKPFTKEDGHIPEIKNISFIEEIEELDHKKAIEKYGKYNVLMMCWPPYDDPMAYESLKEFKGNKLIFIGEGHGGCTGCDNFFELLSKEWNLYKVITLPQWWGIHDSLFLYIRK